MADKPTYNLGGTTLCMVYYGLIGMIMGQSCDIDNKCPLVMSKQLLNMAQSK